jgi:hypothetical protein
MYLRGEIKFGYPVHNLILDHPIKEGKVAQFVTPILLLGLRLASAPAWLILPETRLDDFRYGWRAWL